jgi:hypothetical protein
MNIDIELRWPSEVIKAVEQLDAIDRAATNASASDMVKLMDTWSVMFSVLKQVYGKGFEQFYDDHTESTRKKFKP